MAGGAGRLKQDEDDQEHTMEATLDWGAMARVMPPAQPRPEMVGLVKRAWLLLYTEGGWWTEAEVRAKLRLHVEIHKALREMVEGGFLSRREVTNIDGETSVKYGVVKRCKVPRGVVIEEMWAVLEATAGGRG